MENIFKVPFYNLKISTIIIKNLAFAFYSIDRLLHTLLSRF